MYEIIVNAERKTVFSSRLSYAELVAMACPTAPPYTVCTVVYHNAAGPKPEGSLLPGQSVRVRSGTVFNVVVTGRA